LEVESGRRQRYSRLAACVLVAVLVATALGLYRDYGISWDEPVQRDYGKKVYDHAFRNDDSLLADRHRVYGPVFEVLLIVLENAFRLEDAQDVYFMRHLVTFLMFAAGVFFFYLLGSRILRDFRLGLLGAILFILTPRIFAHAFYNSKDIPFMAMFIVCMYTLLLYLDTRSRRAALMHGVCCAVLVDMRIMGVFIPVLTAGLFAYDMVRMGSGDEKTAKSALNFGLFCGTLIPLTILLWPTLWSNPLINFLEAFKAMSRFAWRATVIFMGKEIWSTELPHHYTLVWIGITVPVVYAGLGIAGMVVAAVRLAGRDMGLELGRRDALLILIWLIVPLGFLIASGAVLYDTWRHIFFVYPAILLLGLVALKWFWRFSMLRVGGAGGRVCAAALAALLALNTGGALSFMVRSHPHQNVYFNSMVGGVQGAAGRFEMDYWGLSYRNLLEDLLEQDTRTRIRIKALNEPGYYNSFILTRNQRERLLYSDDTAGADYYITNFRWDRLKPPPESEAVSVKVDGVSLSAAYRTRYARQ